MSGLRRSLALAAFALRVNLRMPLTRAGVLAGATIVFLGPLLAWRTGRGWQLDGELAFFGVFVAALFLLRSGLEQQRESGLDVFLRWNLASPVEHAAGMVLALLGSWLLLCLGAFGALLVASGGDLGTAAWLTATWGLRGLVALGLVPWVEAWATLRLPFLLPSMLYFGAMIAFMILLGEAEGAALFVAPDRADPTSLAPLLAQALGVLSLTAALFLLAAAAGPEGPALIRKIVPARHGDAPGTG